MKRGTTAVVVAVALAALIQAGPAPVRAGEAPTAPSPKALKKLERAGKAIDQADEAITKGDDYVKALTSAENLKEDFVKRGFAKQTVRGSCGLASLLLGLDRIDRAMARAKSATKDHLQQLGLLSAQAAAGNVSEMLQGCTGGEVAEAVAVLKTIEALGKDPKLKDGELERGAATVARQKKAVVKGERVYGCDVVEIHLLIDRADIAIDLAKIHLPAKADDDELAKLIRERKRRLQDADEAVTALIKHWRKVPCGGTGVPPANEPPKIALFGAVFAGETTCSTCTKYTLLASDSDGTVENVTWKKDPPPGGDPAQTNCGTFDNFERSGNGGSAVWNHPNAADPSASPPVTTPCAHVGIHHPGWITAVVTDDDGATATCVYKNGSTASETFDPAKNCG